MGEPKKPAVWEETMDYTSEMDSYTTVLMNIENAGGTAGLGDDGKLYPHESYEGGTKTVGFGHKLGKDPEIDKLYDFSKGLTEAQAKELFLRDLSSAYKRTWQRYYNKYGQEAWDQLSDKSKITLTDVSFQGGKPSQKLMEAYFERDKKTARDRIDDRGYARDSIIINNYIKDDPYWDTKSIESSLMEKWKKEDNTFA